MNLKAHPFIYNRKLLLQRIDNTLANVAERSDVVGENFNWYYRFHFYASAFIIVFFKQLLQLLFQIKVLAAVSLKQELHHLTRWNTLALCDQFLNAPLNWAARIGILCHVLFLTVQVSARPKLPREFGNETGNKKNQTQYNRVGKRFYILRLWSIFPTQA